MSAFNPTARQLSPDHWQQIALKFAEPKHTQHKVIGGIVLSFLIYAFTASQVCAVFLGAFLLLRIYQNSKQSYRNEDAITQYGCVAHVLNADELRDYITQVGLPEVLRQITWATTHHYQCSDDALELLESEPTPPPTLPLTPSPTPSTPSPHHPITPSPHHPPTPTAWQPPPQHPTIDIAKAIATILKPLIISAKPRVGKGIIVAQAWREAKEIHPNLTVWVIQPKPHPSELGYWVGVDQFWGRFVENSPVNDTQIANELTQFIFDWRAQANRPTLLIVDELVKLEACQPKWYKNFLIPTLKVEASSGETDRRILWALTQSPLIEDLGMSGGNRSAFDILAIEQAASLDHAESMRRSIASIKDVPTAESFTQSPTGNLCFHSRANRWMAVPQYPVYETAPIAAPTYPETTEVYQQPDMIQPPETPAQPPETPAQSNDDRTKRPEISRTDLALTVAELSEWIEATNITEPSEVYAKWKSRKHGFSRPEIRFLLKLIVDLN